MKGAVAPAAIFMLVVGCQKATGVRSPRAIVASTGLTDESAVARRMCGGQPGIDGDGPPTQVQPDMRNIVDASKTVLAIRSFSTEPICIPMRGIDTIDEFYLSENRRLLDFDHSGFDDHGHFLVDRRSRQIIETGTQPESSDDGTMLVAVPPPRHDEAGIDEIGIWQVMADRIMRRATLPLPNAESWRVDRWIGNRCAELSAVSSADYWGPDIDGSDSDAADAAIAKLPQLHFRIRLVDGSWRVEASQADRPCSEIDTARLL